MRDLHDAGCDGNAARVLRQSVVLGGADRLLAVAGSAASRSATAAAIRRARAGWFALQPEHRLRSTGAGLLVAVAVHVGFTLSAAPPPGWAWLIPPALTGVFGVTLIAGSVGWWTKNAP